MGPMVGGSLGVADGTTVGAEVVGAIVGEAVGSNVGAIVGGPSTTIREIASSPSSSVTLTAYVAGKSATPILNGRANIVPPIPRVSVCGRSPSCGGTSVPLAKENSFTVSMVPICTPFEKM